MNYALPGVVPLADPPKAVRHWRAPDPLDNELYAAAHSSGKLWSREKHLWLAVFGQAMEDIRKGRQLEETLDWVGAVDLNVGGFDYVCEILGLDPSATRRVLLAKKPLKKMVRVLVRGRPSIRYRHHRVRGIQPARYSGRLTTSSACGSSPSVPPTGYRSVGARCLGGRNSARL